MFNFLKGERFQKRNESAPRGFIAEGMPRELLDKTYNEAQVVLKEMYGNRLATKADLKRIKKNANDYPYLRMPVARLLAFGSKVRFRGYLYVPCLI